MSETTSLAQEPSQGAMGNWTQDGRLIAIETPLGKDNLLLTSLAGEEAISSLFAYELEMLSTDHAISARKPDRTQRQARDHLGGRQDTPDPWHGRAIAGRTAGRPRPAAVQRAGRAVALVSRAQHRLPHLPEPECSGHHRTSLQDLRVHRLPDVGLAGRLSQARVLRAVPGNSA